jgi:hypothetical protein
MASCTSLAPSVSSAAPLYWTPVAVRYNNFWDWSLTVCETGCWVSSSPHLKTVLPLDVQTGCPLTQHHIPEDLYLEQHCCGNLTFCIRSFMLLSTISWKCICGVEESISTRQADTIMCLTFIQGMLGLWQLQLPFFVVCLRQMLKQCFILMNDCILCNLLFTVCPTVWCCRRHRHHHHHRHHHRHHHHHG